jgi:hypothetical protein
MNMNMDLIDKFVQDARWLARYIELKITLLDADKLTYFFVFEDGSPNRREQIDIVQWLIGLGVIFNAHREHKASDVFHISFLHEKEHIGYSFDIDRAKLVAVLDILKNEDKDTRTVIDEVKLLAKSEPVKQSSLPEQVVAKLPLVNADKRVVTFNGKTTKPISGQNQWVLCKALCEAEIGTWIEENDVINDFKEDNDTAFYDTQSRLNSVFADTFKIQKMIDYQGRKARINPDKLKI